MSRHKIVDIETGENLISDIEFNFIELLKFDKQESELTSIIDQWIYCIKNAENLEVIPEGVEDKGLKTAYTDAARHNWTKEELDAYNYIFMREQDDRGRLTKAQKNMQKKIAKNLLGTGLSVEDVAKNTDLTIEEVQDLLSGK